MEVRSNGDSGKLLFEWNPEKETVDIVKCGMLYSVKLYHNLRTPFSIIDYRPYQKGCTIESYDKALEME